MKHSTTETQPLSRREALKTLLAAGGGVGLSTLPERWVSPVVEAGQLPVHAQASPAPNEPFFRLERVRQLTPCENHGLHHLFIRVVASAGQGLNDLLIRITKDNEFFMARTASGLYLDGAIVDGLAIFAMFKGTYSVQVYSGTSEVASGLTPDNGVTEACGDDLTANAPGHISFEVVFVREG